MDIHKSYFGNPKIKVKTLYYPKIDLRACNQNSIFGCPETDLWIIKNNLENPKLFCDITEAVSF